MVESRPPVLGIAIAGWGRWGPRLGRAVTANHSCHLVAVADPLAERRQHAVSTHSAVRTYASLRALLDSETPAAVVVATPPSTHVELALEALAADVHVLVEKPLAETAAQARLVVDEAARRRRVLMVDHTYLFSVPIRTLRQLIEAGDVCPPFRFESNRLNQGALRHDVGVLQDLAVHDLAMLDYLMPAPPVTIAARHLAPPSDGVVHDAELRVAFADQSEARVRVSWTHPNKVRRVVLADADVSLVADDIAWPNLVEVQRRVGRSSTLACGVLEPLSALIGDFVDAIARGEAVLSDGGCGLRVMAQLDAAQRSLAMQGEPVSLAAGVLGA